MSNVVIFRVFEFLKKYPPFYFIPDDEILLIAKNISIKYLPPGEYLFMTGDQPNNEFYMVQEGAIDLFREMKDIETLIDRCDEGDIFGIRSLLAKDTYQLTAKATEDTLIYTVPFPLFYPLLNKYPKIAMFMATNFAENMGYNPRTSNADSLLQTTSSPNDINPLDEILTIDQIKPPVTCTTATSITAAAQLMTENNVGSIIITGDHNHPLGIITDKDLRSKIVAKNYDTSRPATDIMSSPVICVKKGISLADAQISMLKNKIRHLCVTKNGEKNAAIIGVISEHDLVIQQGNNPALLIRELLKARDIFQLKRIRQKADILINKYLDQEISIRFISEIISEINDALTSRIIDLRLKSYPHISPNDFCWIAIGSAGRREQILKTDQDNALIYHNKFENKDQFIALAENICQDLQVVGFDLCPANMMASNPEWCMSVSEWKNKFESWIYNPGEKELLMSTIFFDYRGIYGNHQFVNELTDHTNKSIKDQDLFIHLLAKNALLNPPPLSFFKNFIVEKDGQHKDEFDIKSRAMMPLTDAARLLVLDKNIQGIQNTTQRFLRLAEQEPQNRELFTLAAKAYDILMITRSLSGLSHNDSGRYIDIQSLDKMQRITLRNSFQPIRELQSLIKVRFQL